LSFLRTCQIVVENIGEQDDKDEVNYMEENDKECNIVVGACPDDNIIYYGQHVTKLECHQCEISRHRSDQVKNKMP